MMMMRYFIKEAAGKCLLTVGALAVLLSGCQTNDASISQLPEVLPRKIIIDTDTGGDDAAAILMAAVQPNVDILGVTVVAGNVTLEQGTQNALMSLEVAGRTDVPVYRGAKASMAGEEFEIFSVYGADGMGDAGLIHPSKQAEDTYAVDFILDTIEAHPNEVELVALGPTTNIAIAIQRAPETMAKVKHIWVMGTAGFGPGNATPVAEFNIFKDPDAFKILADSGLSMTVVGLDTNVESTYITRADQEKLMQGNEKERFVGAAINGLMSFNQTAIGQDIATLPDPIAMACVLWDGYMLESVPCHASVVTDPGETYGQVLFYKEGHGYDVPVTFDSYHVAVASETADEQFKPWFLQTLKQNGFVK